MHLFSYVLKRNPLIVKEEAGWDSPVLGNGKGMSPLQQKQLVMHNNQNKDQFYTCYLCFYLSLF